MNTVRFVLDSAETIVDNLKPTTWSNGHFDILRTFMDGKKIPIRVKTVFLLLCAIVHPVISLAVPVRSLHYFGFIHIHNSSPT